MAIRGHQGTGKLFAAAAVLVVAAALSAGGLFAGGVAASADDNSGGIGITVNVAPTDANAGSGGTGGSGSSGSGSGGSTTPSDSPPVGPSPNTTASPGGGDSVGAIVFVSGLTSRYIWSPNPLHSSAKLSLTVHNVSKTRFDSTARFWVTTTFGAKVSEAREISVHGLKPNETRVIRATLGGLGQWTVLQAHAILTPPKMVDGTPLSPISRDAFILVPPVIVGGVGLGAAFVFVLFKFILFPRLFGIAKAFV